MFFKEKSGNREEKLSYKSVDKLAGMSVSGHTKDWSRKKVSIYEEAGTYSFGNFDPLKSAFDKEFVKDVATDIETVEVKAVSEKKAKASFSPVLAG